MARIKITGFIEVGEELVDRDHPSGLTADGYDEVTFGLEYIEDLDTELVD